MIFPLQLRHDPATDAVPSAWFLPGHSSEDWLLELTRCGLADVETRVFLVPRSVADRTPVGLLVLPATGVSPSHPPRGIACRAIAGRLLLPVDAVLVPSVTDAEVRVLSPLPVAFFHPVFGLSGFDEASGLRVWDLLGSPEERADNWNSARPGAPALPGLLGIVLAVPPSLQDIFGGAEEDIGIEPLLDLPPAPDEPGEGPVSKVGRSLRRSVAKGVARAMRHVPHRGRRRTWLNDVEDWAHRQLSVLTRELDQLRNKELHRLLHLLDADPETGLRHAISLSDFAHRGIAPPSARLGSRSLDFDPSRLGGRATDFWNVPTDLRAILSRRYREMADREMQLGRHRRAAYIYAELLGDLVSAAHALKQGGHFREAALLYEEKLRNPLEAARCLAAGGLLQEAIERYEKLERWMDVAELQERLGNQAAAEAAIRRVIEDHLAQDDILSAARLVEERLRAPQEALDLLLGAWPASRQAAACTAQAFQILARLGQHERAMERVVRFGREHIPPQLVLPVLSVLGRVAHDYPQASVRHRAEDFSRVLIAGQLKQPGLDDSTAGQLAQCLVRLAPRDRLVARDANRYLAQRRAAQLRPRRVTPPPLPGNKPAVERRFELPRQIEWLGLRNEWHWFYALGTTGKHLTLVRGVWDGGAQSVSWRHPASTLDPRSLVFEPTGEQGQAVALATMNGTRLEQKRFPATDEFFGRDCVAGTPEWLSPEGFPVAYGEESAWSCHVAAGRAILSSHDKRGRLQRTIDVTEALLSESEPTKPAHISLAAFSRGAAIALGHHLVIAQDDGSLKRLDLPDQAIGLLVTNPHTRRGVAVMMRHGAVMYWIGSEDWLELARDIPAPMGTFVPGGPLVLIADATMILLTVDSRGVQRVTRVEIPGQRPVGVCAASSPGRFGVLGARGEMTVYRTPM